MGEIDRAKATVVGDLLSLSTLSLIQFFVHTTATLYT
jgi:hypothetical protein